jgi:hypothetical protein
VRAVLLTAALALSACASGVSMPGPGDRLADLDRACRARGGVLVPSGAPVTGRPETDNICRISGPATRLPAG